MSRSIRKKGEIMTPQSITKTKLENEEFSRTKELNYEEANLIQTGLKLILEHQEQNNRYSRHLIFLVATLLKQNKKSFQFNITLSQELNKIKEELAVFTQKEKEKAVQKEAHRNRKRLPKRETITSKIYKLLILAASGSNYTSVRLRIAFCLLIVTGIRISELLPLKVSQVETLRKFYYIPINPPKSSYVSPKACLTTEGKKLVKERESDFEFLFLMKNPDSYIFTPEYNHSKMLSRETITRDVNNVLRSVSKSLPDQPNITSHSFRIGYIYELWKDMNDIERVKQSVGHKKINSTFSYLEELKEK